LEQLAVDPAFAPREWAVKQLCDMGSLISYPVVQQAIRKMDAGDQPRAEDEISFCLQRIEIIRSNPDRTKALMSALSPDPNQRNTRLVSWAVNQLLAVGSPDALQSLAKFSKTIGGMPHASTRATLAPIKERIDEELRKSAPAH
jgi:hypothetical protein